MSTDDQTRLRRNYLYLLRNLRTDDLVDYLFQEGVISEDNSEDIESERKSRDKTKKLLRILPKKGPKAFEKFINVLRETENGFIADQLEQTDLSQPYDLDSPVDDDEDQEAQRKMSNASQSAGDSVEVLHLIRRQMSEQAHMLWETKYEMDRMKEKMINDEEESARLRQKLKEMEDEAINKGYTEKEIDDRIADILKKYPSGEVRRQTQDHDVATQDEPEGVFTDTEDLDRDSIKIEARLVAKDLVGYVAKTKSGPPPNKHCQTMRNTVDELLVRYEKVFDRINLKLGIDEKTTYTTFESIANEVLEGDINWGRVVAVYAYSGSLARYCVQQGMGSLVDKIGEFTGKYAARVLCDWIKIHGGWVCIIISLKK